MRKKKWVPEFLAQEEEYLLKDMKNQKCDLPLYVEIGMGMGDFITQSAKMNLLYRSGEGRNLFCQSDQKGQRPRFKESQDHLCRCDEYRRAF